MSRYSTIGPEALDAEIQRLNDTPIDSLKFRDFLDLQAGRDEWSGRRLSDLRMLVPTCSLRAAEEAITANDKALATCLRWMLRGLQPDKAIRKVRVDAEVSVNAIDGYYKRQRRG